MLAASAARRDMRTMPHHNRLITRTLAALALGLAAAPTYAREAPNPPPSGIVIHLFGPNSVSSHFLPTGPEAQSGNAASTATERQSTSGTPGATPANGQAAAPESGPSWGDIAHQMFVTGDPSQEGAAALPKGKAGNQ